MSMAQLKVWDYSAYKALFEAILWALIEGNKAQASLTRDRIYLDGIFCMLHQLSEEEALGIWEEWEDNNLECLREKKEL